MSVFIRPVRIEGNDVFITLTKGYEAVVDLCDIDMVAPYNWTAAVAYKRNGEVRTVYAYRQYRRGGKYVTEKLHRILTRAPAGVDVDHVDGSGLNNRRRNLRLASRSQNNFNARKQVNNTSGVKGVPFYKRDRNWSAELWVNNRKVFLGRYSTKEEAAAACAAAREKHHGAFANAEGHL